ncbi:MAG: hypothetical protein ACI9YL_000372 [Luteibaculaceae bacterium]|jgi:hypothetical protein
MENSFQKVKNYVLELGYQINLENEEEGIVIISNPTEGIQNMVLGVADPLLIMEQYLIDLPSLNAGSLQKLLQKNRDIVHGAFVLDESGSRVLFRDTLQSENLDLNELEGSLNSLSLLLSEYSGTLLSLSKNV